MKHIAVISKIGANRVLGKPSQEQPLWNEHAAFMNNLDDQGYVYLAGPFADGSGALLILNIEDEASALALMQNDPWALNDIQSPESVKEWLILMDSRDKPAE